MSGEMADVEAPVDGPLDLGAALLVHLIDVGVLPQVYEGPGEAAVPVQQGRGAGHRRPAVKVVFGVERQMCPDVLTPVAGGRLSSPWPRDHEARRRRQSRAQGVVDG